MTLQQALGLKKGDYVMSPRTSIPHRPIRITDCWINKKETLVQLRLASLDATAWMDATAFELTPEGKLWDEVRSRWVTKEDFKAWREFTKRPSPTEPLPIEIGADAPES